MEIFIGLVAVLLIPYKIETSIIVDASKEEVMRVLKEFENYEKWNPFIIFIRGKFRINSVLNIKLNMNDKIINMSPKIIAIEDDKFCWKGVFGLRYIFDGIHCFKTESIQSEKTLFTHTEHFQGILVWLMFPMLLKTKRRFELINVALKEELINIKKFEG